MTLPAWCTPLLDGARMRATDAWAIEQRGIPGPELMERAGAALARVVLTSGAPDGPVAVLCGKGNNGGDGYVAARHLRAAGRDVRLLAVAPVGELEGDAAHHAARIESEPWDPARLEGAAVVVDCLLGTGASGEPRGAVREAVEATAGRWVVACDVPSGVDASTGEVAGVAVRARVTATFHAAKPGLWIAPGKAHAGRIEVLDIGIPHGAPADPPDVGLIEDATLLARLPRRQAGWTKFDSGRVLVAGGSRGLTGAPRLAAEAAMRAGAGYVTVLAPESAQQAFDVQLVEVMTRGLPEVDGTHSAAGVEAVRELAERGGVVVLGPGLGRTDDARAFARGVAALDLPLVVDADGLRAGLERRGAVLTPHEGELGAVLGVPSDEIKARRLHFARRAARETGCVVVLKGDDTLVADPGGAVAVSPGATGALATAGTGDVLAGVTGAVLARGVPAFEAAAAAVRLHALAGLRAAEEVGAEGVVARDVIAALPRVVSAR